MTRRTNIRYWLADVLSSDDVRRLGTMRRKGRTVAQIISAAYDMWKAAGFPRPDADFRVKASRAVSLGPECITYAAMLRWLNRRFGPRKSRKPRVWAKRRCWLDGLFSAATVKKLRAMQLRGADWSAIADVANQAWKDAGYPNMPPRMGSRNGAYEPWIWVNQLRYWFCCRFGSAASGGSSAPISTPSPRQEGVSQQLAEKRGARATQASVAPKNRERGLVKNHNGLPEGVSEGSTPRFKKNHVPQGIEVSKAAKSGKGYRHPRLGEKRKVRRPLHIDKLPAEVRETIVAARAEGKTWTETAQLASEKAGHTLPVTSVARWYDLRIEQPSSGIGAIVPLLHEIIDLLKSRLPAVNA